MPHGGVNPFTKENLIGPATCHYTLAAMDTAGMYETSGDWLYDVGLPGKTGTSVKGQLVAKFLSQRLGMDLFLSRPEE